MYRILIAEDEDIIRRGVCTALDWQSLECEVCAAVENGLEAESVIKKTPPDILLCDIRMPGKSGLDLAQYIAQNKLDIKVILLTGYQEFSYAQRAIAFSVFEYLLKPVDEKKLAESISRAISALKEQRAHPFTSGAPLTSLVENVVSAEDAHTSQAVQHILHYLYKHYQDNIALNDVAALVNMNPSYVSRIIKRETGHSFIDTLMRIRVDKAMALLAFPEYRAYEVASLVGISDPKYFSQIFRRLTGLTPSQYRRQSSAPSKE